MADSAGNAKSRIGGIWPPVLLEWDDDGRVDLDAVATVVRHYAKQGVHGIYTADTASEFYNLEFDEWNQLTTRLSVLARECGLPAAVGCTWTNQEGILKRVARARELGFDHIHLSQPYWIRLNEPSQRTFWQAVERAASGLPIVVYAGSQGQFPLDGDMLGRLRECCPSITGTKSMGFDAVATSSLLLHHADLSHFVQEQMLAPWAALGAAGCFSTLVSLNPKFTIEWFAAIQGGQWEKAFAIQRRVSLFYDEGAVPIRRAGYAIDKPIAVLGRVPGVTLRMQPPYASVPDDLFRKLETAVRRHLPECFADR